MLGRKPLLALSEPHYYVNPERQGSSTEGILTGVPFPSWEICGLALSWVWGSRGAVGRYKGLYLDASSIWTAVDVLNGEAGSQSGRNEAEYSDASSIWTTDDILNCCFLGRAVYMIGLLLLSSGDMDKPTILSMSAHDLASQNHICARYGLDLPSAKAHLSFLSCGPTLRLF